MVKGEIMEENVLKVTGLVKKFGSKTILNNVNLEVKAGEVMGFLGPNGAGKTTAIKAILGFLIPNSGDIEICGYDITKHYEDAMALSGGIVENPDMYKNFSGMLNLRMYARTHDNVSEERIQEVVKLVGLENRIGEKVKKYSLGMKQRLGLAVAMLHSPKLLILDEPTNGLDPAGIRELREIIVNLAHQENVGVLISSHQLAELQNMCDRVTIIDKGTVLCEKSLSELSDDLSGVPQYKVTVSDPKGAIETIKAYFTDNENQKSLESVKCNGETGEINFIAETDNIPKIIGLLVKSEVEIFEVKKIENSLEDAFMAITGGGNTIA